MKRSYLYLLIFFLCGWFLSIFNACQPVYDEEEIEESQSATSQSVKVMARASGETNILYPAYIFAFKENGEYATHQMMTGPDMPIELKLAPAQYTLVAIAGINDEYTLPQRPQLTDVITLKQNHRSGRALMMGRATTQIKANSSQKVTITLYYVVSLVNVTLEGISNEAKKVKLQLSPVYTSLAFNGEYGEKDKTVEVECTPESDGIWGTEPFYIFPGNASHTTFTITIEDNQGVHTYGYTFKGRPQANVPFNIGACFQGDVTLGGILVPSNWEQAIEVKFQFGQSPEESGKEPSTSDIPNLSDIAGLPSIGKIWNQGIVVGALPNDQGETPKILLLSLQENYTLLSKLNETIQDEINAGWRLPTSDEAHWIQRTFSGEMFNTVNQQIAAHDSNLPLLDIEKRYLYDNQGSFFAFGFKSGSKFLGAGQTVKYKVRLVREMPISD